MQGIAFQGAFFAASPTMQNAGLTENALFAAIEAQLQSKFGGKGARVVADNLRVVKRGFTELTEITEKEVGKTRKQYAKKDAGLPIMLREMPEGDGYVSDIHRFWEQTGNFYLTGKGSDNLVDPFIGTSLMPAATGVFRDMTGIRFEHPVVDRRELHGLRQLLHRMPGLGDSRSGELRRRRLQYRRSTASRPPARRRASCAAPRAPSRRNCAA